ncbi:LodA/GoxA family CTQ-dependent oxidase [Methylovulum psychrotolerans]|uniref:L-lysine 6-oxidase n=1 Tax=Methylovulum psychrotolerans TaxID=1704499 RepID=A0A2S5CI43_9GAMM|nr:LodA/GoxA family CTQ-dependent oxidase [Methylovulum psychrotolerans]MBT9100041.1 LodA/GoxA family CTQ-dependent oxidase [Methylovulum psychrotolerans]POZ50437.1 L-lysine 6-oxidase [Methylovulum psychrotolerans]
MATYKIHPGIGIARLGNSTSEFYIAPEMPANLPQQCDAQGNPLLTPDLTGPLLVNTFKDKHGRIKRQAARFQVYVYDADSPEGRPLQLGDPVEGGGNHGVLTDIQWRVYLANKKASWYDFQQLRGEHGYDSDHPRRNPDITDRDRLVIDPGPRSVNTTTQRRARFDRTGDGAYATTFPPRGLQPHDIDTLGEILTDDAGRLLVLGGHGHSGCEKTGPGEPHISDYANNDGWYDDTSDGPVMARLIMYSEQVGQTRYIDVEYPAWVVAGYPRFVPQILDMITADDVLYDLSLRQFAADTRLYGRIDSFADPETIPPHNAQALAQWQASRLTWNPTFKPGFYCDIWPILFRPNEFLYLSDILAQSNFPHDPEQRGTFDPRLLSQPPRYFHERADYDAAVADSLSRHQNRNASQGEAQAETRKPTPRLQDGLWVFDPYAPMRQFLFDLLRRGGEENDFKISNKVGSRIHNLPLMPLLCGDNPLSNLVPSKFLRLTDYQLFVLKQWALGYFSNEIEQGCLPPNYPVFQPYPTTPPKNARELDRGVLSNLLGGAFCPGGEIGWVLRNPSIYLEPYRIKADRSWSDFLQSAAQANAKHGSLLDDNTFAMDSPLSQNNDYNTGLQPGDLTKSMAVPWQADFNECTTNTIDITYAEWNLINTSDDARMAQQQQTWDTLWWPAHRPLQSNELVGFDAQGQPQLQWTTWSRGIQQTNAGDLKMVSDWWRLGFIIRNPHLPPSSNVMATPSTSLPDDRYYSVERSGPDTEKSD